jgi:glycerophosphoryl diester phosphodiesterase
MIHKAFTMAQEVYDLRMCELQSFDFDNLVRAHEAFPDLKIMLTCSDHNADVDRCLEYGFDIDMDYRGIGAETVKTFRDAGLLVGLWTANTKEALDFCLGMDVDFIESDVFANEKGE